jgi:methionyl-tRNA formyltransferase
MDAGPIYAIKKFPLTGHETQPDLYRALAITGTNLLLEALPAIIDGLIEPVPQRESAATYCSLLEKSDGYLDTKILDAAQAERHIRAHLTYPKSRVPINGQDTIITKAHVSNEQKTPLDVLCHDGAFLSIDELVAPSGRRVSAQEYLRGYAAKS